MNQIIRAIKKLVMEPIKRLQDTTKRFSEPLTIDLSEARNQKEYQVYGDVLIVEDIDGIATVCLNHKESSQLTLRIGRKIYQDFWRFFITNTAQAGKTLKIVVGREGCFDISETDYWLSILNDKQDDAKVTLDSIDVKVGKFFVIVPSEDLLISNDDVEEWSIGGSGGVMKMKEYFIQVSGLFRVKFDLRCSSTPDGEAQIYRNGVPYGTPYGMTTSWVTKSQDLPFIAGDLCQLYIIDGYESQSQYVRNHRLYGAWSMGIALETT